MQHEAHLLANLFTSFEKERIFARVHSPFLTTAAVQKRLARQGSKFAGCRAFRIYRFRDGAWQEIILGAVMGAARRAELKRAADARDITSTAWPTASVSPPAARAGRTSSPDAGSDSKDVDRPYAAHGPYARAAREELSIRPERDAEFEGRAANSNTAPASRAQPMAVDRPGGAAETSPTVVPLPVRPRAPAPGATPAGFETPPQSFGSAAVAAESASLPVDPPPAGMVDIVMRRETATFRVPVSQATLPVTLFGESVAAPEVVADSGVEWAEVRSLAAPDPLLATEEELFDVNELGHLDDDDIDGAANIAGRLRPAIPKL
jgi:hypothetical protein